MRVAVCDDKKINTEIVAQAITHLVEKRAPDKLKHVHIYEYNSGSDLLDAHLQDPFDVIFLDIEMPGLDGMAVAKSARILNSDLLIIIVSAYPAYSRECYKYNAFRYVLKASFKEEIDEAIEAAFQQFERIRSTPTYVSEYRGDLLRVRSDEIVCFQGRKHGSLLYLNGKTEPKKDNRSIAELAELFQGRQEFIQANTSWIVNLDYLRRISGNDLILTNDIVITLGKNSISEIKLQVNRYYANYPKI